MLIEKFTSISGDFEEEVYSAKDVNCFILMLNTAIKEMETDFEIRQTVKNLSALYFGIGIED